MYADRRTDRWMDGREDVTKPIDASGNCAKASTDYTFCPQSVHLLALYMSLKIESGIIILTKLGDWSSS